ncbi:MAG: GspH/FimT family pseudopilin [Pseudohongiellaceae bacterium]
MSPTRAKKPSKINGYTLIELLIVMSIAATLVALSAPAFQDTIEATNTNSQIKVMLTTLNLARSEAIKRGQDVSICASDDGVDCNADTVPAGWCLWTIT